MRLTPLLAAAGLLALTACAPSATSSGTSSQPSSSGKVTLSYWQWGPIENQKKMFAEYEKTHPGVTIEPRQPGTPTEYDTILSTGLAGEKGPDVVLLRAGANLQPLVEAGRLEPIDPAVVKDFDPQVIAAAKGDKDGKVYGVPFALQTLNVIYNKKIFADNGITPPTTWDEMLASAEKLKSKGVIPFAFGGKDDWMLPVVASIFGTSRWGGDAFLEAVKAKRKKFADPDFVAGIDLLNKLMPYFPKDAPAVSYTDAQILFSSGKAAMFPGGVWELSFFKENAPGIELGTFTPPPSPGSVSAKPQMPGFTDGSYGVNAKSPHKKEAMEFVSWLATKEYGQLYADTVTQFSAVPGIKPKDPLLGQIATEREQDGAAYFMNAFAYGNPSSQAVFSGALQKMLLGKITPKQAAEDLDKSVATWLK